MGIREVGPEGLGCEHKEDLKMKIFRAKGRRGMVKANSLVSDLRKAHQEMSDLAGAFSDALAEHDKKRARRLLARIDEMASGHLSFEQGYLYPRMRRLVSEMMNRFDGERKTIKEFIEESRGALGKGGLSKNQLSSLSKMLKLLVRPAAADCSRKMCTPRA